MGARQQTQCLTEGSGKQQQFLTDRGVAHFDAVRETMVLVGDAAPDPMARQLLVTEAIQMSEGFRGEAGNAKAHDDKVATLRWHRNPDLAV